MKTTSDMSSSRPLDTHENKGFQGVLQLTMKAKLPLCCFSSNLPGTQPVENTRVLHPGATGADGLNNGGFDYSVPLGSIFPGEVVAL
jgi:hypothetical protein